jgi:hypothetical protein
LAQRNRIRHTRWRSAPVVILCNFLAQASLNTWLQRSGMRHSDAISWNAVRKSHVISQSAPVLSPWQTIQFNSTAVCTSISILRWCFLCPYAAPHYTLCRCVVITSGVVECVRRNSRRLLWLRCCRVQASEATEFTTPWTALEGLLFCDFCAQAPPCWLAPTDTLASLHAV